MINAQNHNPLVSPYPASLDTMRIARLEGRAMRDYEMGIHYGNNAHLGNSIKHLEDSYKTLHNKTSSIESLLTAMRNPESGIMSPNTRAVKIANLRRAVERRSGFQSPTRRSGPATPGSAPRSMSAQRARFSAAASSSAQRTLRM